MTFKAALCEKCGATFAFDVVAQVLFCEHCGETRNIVSLELQLLKAYEWAAIDNYDKAEEYLLEAARLDPTNVDIWYELLRLSTRHFEADVFFYESEDVFLENWRHTLLLRPSAQQLDSMILYAQGQRDICAAKSDFIYTDRGRQYEQLLSEARVARSALR